MPRAKKYIPEAVSIRKAADVLGVTPLTVRRWIRRRYLLAYRVGPQIIRIPRSEISRMRKHLIDTDHDPVRSAPPREL